MHKISEISTAPEEHAKLAAYLATFEDEDRGIEFWKKRLKFWWVENPAATETTPRGWTLCDNDKIVGFLGLIPFDYVCAGQNIKAIAATTWRVDEQHRNASLPMFLKYHRLSETFPILDTTPNEEVRKILQRFKYQHEPMLHRNIFLIGNKGSMLRGIIWKAAGCVSRLGLPKTKLKIVKITDQFTIDSTFHSLPLLQKKVTRDYLRWYCSSPAERKLFIGCANSAGVLTSYIIFREEPFRDGLALSSIDHFAVRSDTDEILRLIRFSCEHPDYFDRNRNYNAIFLNSFSPEFTGKGLGVFRRQSEGKHYYFLPKSLAGTSKRCVLAEGDFGC